MDGCQSWKLALETSANFVATRAGNSRWNPARVSRKCVMGIMYSALMRRQDFNMASDVIVTGSGDCTAKAWSLDTAKCLRTFRGHLGAINTMTTDNIGRTLFTGSMDHTIRSFEVETGRPLFVFRGHDGPVLYITVS